MTLFHISDLKKYTRCPRLYINEQKASKREYRPYVRLDEQVTDLAAKKLGIDRYFLGERGDSPSKAIEAMKDYEWLVKARFEYDRLRIKVPFLHHTEEGWELYYLFVGLYPHAGDMQFYCDMMWVLENNGIKISAIHMIHLNANYVRRGELDPEELFVVGDYFYNANNNPTVRVEDAVRSNMKDLHGLMDDMEACTEETLSPVVRSSKCTGRQKCRYYDDCFPNEETMEDNSILTLISSGSRYQMLRSGCKYLKDADVERIEGSRQQYAQIMADRNGGMFVDKAALRSWLSHVEYPITFLDFEWERFAIPPYEGMKPYGVLPFEYSIHILQEDGTMTHTVFLSIHDDRREMTEGLLRDIPETGSVVAYNAIGAEMIRIREFAEEFPEYAERLLKINERMQDLQIPFETGSVYDIRQGGLWSLKKIMSLMNDKSYQDLDINQGMDAVFEWRHLDYEEHVENEAEIIENLKKYCGMDSYAMTVIYKWLKELAE